MANRIKVGVVGVGNMGRNHLRVLSTMPEYELVGCYDVSRDAVEQQAGLYGIKAFKTPEELFGEVDLAHIVVPSFLHKEYAVAAADAGCHVLVEKPIALSVDDAQAIIAACASNGVGLCVGHVERFNPAIIALSDILKGEEALSLSFERMSPFDGRIADADVVQDLMIHDIDVLNSIVDRPIKRIVSHGTKPYTPMLDFAQALITYEGGVVASLTASRITESKIRKAEINAKNAFIHVDYLDRKVEVSRKTNFTLDIGHQAQYKQENIIERVYVNQTEPLRSEFAHFAQCIATGTIPVTNGEMGKRALEMCLAISQNALV